MPAKNGAGDRLVSLGSSPAREYSLDKPTIAIGSHPKNDVVADNTTVSRRHATITRKGDGFELADLGSTNGTFVNSRRLTEPVALKPGDEIKFGSVRFAFNPQSAPRRMWVGLLITTLALVAGFAFARHNPAMRPALSALFGESSSPEVSPAPTAMNTQSPASINTQSVAANEGPSASSAAAAPPPPGDFLIRGPRMAAASELLPPDGEAAADIRRSGGEPGRSRACHLHRQELSRSDRAQRAWRRDAHRGSRQPGLHARRARGGEVERHGRVEHARRIGRRCMGLADVVDRRLDRRYRSIACRY